MKNILSYKKVLLISSLIGAGIIPITTLTSCANTKVFFIPVQTGGATTGPYTAALGLNGAMNADSSSENQFASAPDDLTGPERNKIMIDYLPSNYIYDSNAGAMYGYGSYEKMTGDVYNGDSTYGWNLPVMPSYLSDDGTKLLSSKNADINTSIMYSNNTAYTLRSYVQYMLTYMFQTGVVAGTDEHQNLWWNSLFGGGATSSATDNFVHGDKNDSGTKQQNTDFYSFMYDLQNLLGEGKNNIQFGVDNVQWQYESSLFGPGPLLTSNSLKYYKNDGTKGNTNAFPMTGVELLTDNLQNRVVGHATRNSGYVSPYVTYYKADGTEAKYDGTEANLITSAQFTQVPVLIHPSTVDFTFYNYIDKQSFAPTDWKINDFNKVDKQSKKAIAWKNFKNYTGSENTVGSLNWTVNTDNGDKETSLSLKPSAIHDSKVVDYGLQNITRDFSDDTYNNLNSNDFVGLANYLAVVEPNANGGAPIIRPYCTGVSDIYPILSLFKGTDAGNLTFDESILSRNIVHEKVSAPDEQSNIWMLDSDLLDKKLNNSFTGYYSNAVKKDENPKTDDDSLYSMLFTKFLLGNYDGTTDSSSLFKKL